ncbi:MAG: hypothetical protein KI790_17370 [Cyclobacteriaceae bacterium]|nr:hypothetical protein [Cyclobacteriaceae bacterium HetDA_MAG_MS6]
MGKSICFQLAFILTTAFQSCKVDATSYFDQKPPSDTPKIFAPKEVNTDSIELNVVFNTSFTEMFFSRIVDRSFVIHHSELIDGSWSPIQLIEMYPDSIPISVACDPTITQDGNTMYFLGVDPENYSNSITPAELYRIPPDIYVSKKLDGKWQYASKVESPVSTEHFESYPIAVGDKSLYFQSNRPNGAGGRDTYRAQYLSDGRFETPISISLNSEKNAASTYVNPDEDYLIASSSQGFQVSFKENGKWQVPIPVEMDYDKDWRYYCPYMSPDEKYFFFSRRYSDPSKRGWAGVSKGEVYWVSADVIFDQKSK